MIMGHWEGCGSMLVDIGMVAGEELTGEPVAPGDVDEASLEQLSDEREQPMAGRFLGLTVLPPREGKQFHPHRWRVLSETEKKEAAEEAKRLKIAPTPIRAPEKRATSH
jgi:hypothetical protein